MRTLKNLILSRRELESVAIRIGDCVAYVDVLEIRESRVRLGLRFPAEAEIMRTEILRDLAKAQALDAMAADRG